tara:strand:+ start:128 stop:448 length:321 start_codon:yes stop_codon:yes gene_type:complete
MAKRAGSFSGCFDPHTLDKFRDLCLKQGRQYTKVLERLAEAYIYTDGSILHEPRMNSVSEVSEEPATVSDIKDLQDQIDAISKELNCNALDLKIKSIEKKLKKLEK